jgi:hypothetical protein
MKVEVRHPWARPRRPPSICRIRATGPVCAMGLVIVAGIYRAAVDGAVAPFFGARMELLRPLWPASCKTRAMLSLLTARLYKDKILEEFCENSL